MTRRTLSLVGLGLAVVLFVAINVLAQAVLRDRRLDLTEDGLYTLSPGTVNVIRAVQEPITLRLFYSGTLAEKVPALRTYGNRVRELLETYAARSGGTIRLEVIDPEPYSDAEDRAVAAGVRGVPLDGRSGEPFYFGLVGNDLTDRQEVIAFFQQEREAFLEYDVTRIVQALSQRAKTVVGVLTGMPLEFGPGGMMAAMRGAAQPYAILSQLRGFFDVKVLDPAATAAVPDEVAVLVVARPHDLSDAALYAIDQYVMKGGPAVFLADPFAESQTPEPGAPPDPSASKTAIPGKLFDAWGIELPADRFVADPALAISVSGGSASRRRAVPYPAWIAVGDANRDLGDAVTAQIGTVNLASAGSLSLRTGGGLTLTPLITSSPSARLLPTSELQGRPEPEKLMAQLGAGGGAHVLAARLSGSVRSAFPDGPPKAPPPAEGQEAAPEPAPPAAGLKESRGPVNLIVIADSDFIEDRFWVDDQSLMGQRMLVPFAGNADLLLNAVENLAGGADLIGLRGRAGSARPFLVVEALRRAAGQQMLAREQELTERLSQTERQIAELQGKAKGGAATLLSGEESKAIERFQGEVLRIRRELREVQHALNRDIESLSATVKAVNIVAVPLLVAVAAVGVAGVRARRRGRRAARD